MGLVIRSSSIHAAGCYTTTPIRKGSRVVEYAGPRISKESGDARYRNSRATYLFGLGNGSVVIDGHGTAMFINHSCDPNCEADESAGRVWIVALRDIAPGEELTYDYNLYDGGEDDARCNCGAAKCRRTMYSQTEVRRRRRAERRTTATNLAAKKTTAPATRRSAGSTAAGENERDTRQPRTGGKPRMQSVSRPGHPT